MRVSVPLLLLMLLSTEGVWADRHKPLIDPESQDGILIQRIQQEPTLPRKQTLLEKFVVDFPNATSIAWVYEQLLLVYKDAKDNDKVIATADGMLTADPNDLDAAHDALRAAETKNDPQLMQKYAVLAWDIASRTSQSAKPTDPDEIIAWTKQTQFAKDVMAYAEYTLASLAKSQTDEQKRVQIVALLQQ